MNNKEFIWHWLWERIGNEYGVAGLMGNLMAESSLRPDNLQNAYEKSLGMTDAEYVKAVDELRYQKDDFVSDGAGFGIAQWTYWSRKRGLYEYAEETGKSIGDLEMQLEYLWIELGREYKNVLTVLLGAASVREASDAVLLWYERPADQSAENLKRRTILSEKIYNEMSGKVFESGAGKGVHDKVPMQSEKPVSVKSLTVYKRLFYNSDCYKSGTIMAPTGVQVHSTGANNPWLKRYVQPDDGRLGKNPNNNDHNRAGNVCANAYIGKLANGEVAVYEALPWDMRCWLSGSGDSGNANRLGYIGYEICEDGLTDRVYFDAVMEQAVLLTAYLCQAYNISPDNIRDHAELHEMGLASNHKDITHWLKNFGMNMNDFRNRVIETMAEPIDVKYVDCDEVEVLFQAKVDDSGRLNVRSGPGTKYSVLFQAQKGSVLDVLDDTNDIWWRVRQNGVTGYAMCAYLKKIEPETPEVPELPEEPIVKVVLELPQSQGIRVCRELADQLGFMIVDARSGNVSNIDYQ